MVAGSNFGSRFFNYNLLLKTLYIKDFAIIEELEVHFDSGLNIITGETGAGKSILMGALKMILGERASHEIVRAGAKKAIVEGHFEGAGSKEVGELLVEMEIDEEPSLMLRRDISESRSRAFVNDTPVPAGSLKRLAGHSIDLHGQHEHQSLLRTEIHVQLLDEFGGLGSLVDAYQALHQEIIALKRERAEISGKERELKEKAELVGFQIKEIDEVNPVDGEEAALETELRVLDNAERLAAMTESLHQLLYGNDRSVYDLLVLARNELQDLQRIDEQFEDVLSEIRSAEITVAEANKFIQDYNANVEHNPSRLEEVRTRLGAFDTLKRRYGGSIEAVLGFRNQIGEAFKLASDFDGALAELDERIATAAEKCSKAASKLSRKRHEVARKIEKGIERELLELGFGHARFKVHMEVKPDEGGWITLDGKQPIAAFANGVDVVEFFISTNVGEEPRPLVKVASGGEVSRIMLALKSVLAKSERLPILVFDEIDVGISGSVAHSVGASMRKLAQYHQIIAITHLPQIAAQGDAHFVVEKQVNASRTTSGIRRLTPEEREREIASLLSADKVSDAALESARELIAGASR